MSVFLRHEPAGIRQCPGCLAWSMWSASLVAGAGYPEPVWIYTCDSCGEWAWL